MTPRPITAYVRDGDDWHREVHWVVVVNGECSPMYPERSLAKWWGLMRQWRLI